MDFEWNIFPVFNTLQLSEEVKSLLLRLGETPENLTGRIFSCRCSTTFPVDQETMKKNACQMPISLLYLQGDLEQDNGHLLVLVLRKWYSISEDSPQDEWDYMAERMLLEFAESGHPIFRATSPLSRGQVKSKGHGKLSIHYPVDLETIETIFRTIISVNQLSLYGAVANKCEEYESLHDRSGQRDKVMGQSIVLSEIKTDVLLENDDPAYQNFVLQQYEERIERLTQQDKVSKFCMDAGFLSVVEIGQYFMTKDTEEQFFARACREYTLPRDDGSSQPRGWIQGNTKIGPVLEVTTSCLYGKHGVEIRTWSLSKDNSQSWVRISHGSNRFVMNLNNNEQEIPEVQLEEYALKLDAKDFACRSKAEAKPQRREPAGSSPRTIPIEERIWTDVEPGEYSLSDYAVSKKLIHLLRHARIQREEDGAIEFWRLKDYLRNDFVRSQHWSDEMWKKSMARRRRKQANIPALY